MEYKDYYKILGVDRKATSEQIKQAYRRLARKYHPDVSKEKNAEEQFKNVQEAYEVLKDAEKRSAYDQLGSNWKQGQEFRRPPNWEGAQFYGQDSGGFGGEGDFGGFSDFFANLFGGGRGGSRAQGFHREDFGNFRQRGSDQHAKISIGLEEAFNGGTRQIRLQMPEVDANGQVQSKIRTLNITIPKGATSGQQLRLSGQGMPGVNGGPNGDLYLEIDISPHPFYTLKDHDIYITLPVAPWEAALGAEIKVPTLAGPVGLKLAPGTQSNQKLRLKGRGMPGKQPGDQYAVVQIQVPSAKTTEDREIYEKMAQRMPFNPRQHWPI